VPTGDDAAGARDLIRGQRLIVPPTPPLMKFFNSECVCAGFAASGPAHPGMAQEKEMAGHASRRVATTPTRQCALLYLLAQPSWRGDDTGQLAKQTRQCRAGSECGATGDTRRAQPAPLCFLQRQTVSRCSFRRRNRSQCRAERVAGLWFLVARGRLARAFRRRESRSQPATLRGLTALRVVDMANPALGYGMALVSCLFFGSNFVVTKRFPTGDGFFFNWAMTSAIFVCGLLFHVGLCGIEGQCPRFEPFAMLGGAIWCIGNLWVVPIVQCIGLGLGLCVWGSSNMLTGWASAHFGILGLKADPAPASPVLHYIGVALAVCSMATFLLIKSSVGDEDGKMTHEHAQALLAGREAGADRHSGHAEAGSLQVDVIEQPPSRSWVDRLSPAQRKTFGLTFSLISGVCYGG